MAVDLKVIFTLLVCFQIKHFISDFPLQREYMLKKTLPGWGFLMPLTVHCSVHMLITLTIVLWVNPQFWWLCLYDFCIHFVMDRIKSGPRYLGRFIDKKRPGFWNCFGLDQMVHHLTHYSIIYYLVTHSPDFTPF